MDKYFKDFTQRNAFVTSSIVIFIIFGLIGYSGVEKFGYSWQLLVIFPIAPIILIYRNFIDRNNG